MTQLRLYGFPVSPNVRSARLAFWERGVDVDFHQIIPDYLSSDSYGEINPFRRMPALVMDERTFYETPALMVLANSLGAGPSLEPGDAVERARMWQFIGIAQHYLYPVGAMTLYFHTVLAGVFGMEPDASAAEAAVAPTATHLDVLEQALAHGYLAGSSLSLADLYCGSMVDYIARCRVGRTLVDERPALAGWLSALRSRESFPGTFAPMLVGTDQQ
jgi:glutathione S-transferase